MYKVTIDPGHGGKDRANTGPTGYVEADGTLRIALLLEAELLKTGAFKVQLTRRTDQHLTLTARAKMAVRDKSDLFISEHTNASNTKARGTVVFYSVDLPGDRVLAERLSSAVAGALGIRDRGAKTRASLKNPSEDYYTVMDTAQDGGVPHVILVENAFHDNPEDEKLLKDDRMLRKIAEAQARVISDWFGVKTETGEDAAVPDIQRLPVLKVNDRGESVKLLQALLNRAGSKKLKEDGIFGPKTLESVKAFQKAKGLAVDGIVGPITWGALYAGSNDRQ